MAIKKVRNIFMHIPLGDLKPAAARLLLALLTSGEDESWSTVLIRSGIHDVKTYVLARLSLEKQGFIVDIAGREYVTLHAHIGTAETPAGDTAQAGEEVVDTGITQPVNIPPFGFPNSENVKAREEAAEVNAMNVKKVPPFSTAWAAVTHTRKKG